MVCRICTDEKRKAHKEDRNPIYNVVNNDSLKTITKQSKTPMIQRKAGTLANVKLFDWDFIEYGQVYLIGLDAEDIEEAFTQPVKIGYTTSSVKGRLAQLNSSHWKKLKTWDETMTIPEPIRYEKYLHEKYKDRRVGKEWFNLDPYMTDEFQEDAELCYFRPDFMKEFYLLKDFNSTNTKRMEAIQILFDNILTNTKIDLNPYWEIYWNENDLRFYQDNFYEQYVKDFE